MRGMFCTKLLKHVSTLSKKKKDFMCKFVSINIKCPSWQSKDVFVTWWMLQRITSFKKSGMWLRPVMSCVCCLHTGRLIHIWNHNVLTEHCSIEILGPRKKTKKSLLPEIAVAYRGVRRHMWLRGNANYNVLLFVVRPQRCWSRPLMSMMQLHAQ